jgi:hypothetical protein
MMEVLAGFELGYLLLVPKSTFCDAVFLNIWDYVLEPKQTSIRYYKRDHSLLCISQEVVQ